MRRWVFPWKFTFLWRVKRTRRKCCLMFLEKIFFLEILALLHYVSTTNENFVIFVRREERTYCKSARIFWKIIFFGSITHHFRQARFAIHKKVNFYGKTQRLIYFLEDCNLIHSASMFFDIFEKLNSITVFKLLSKMSSTLKQLENKTAIRKLVAALRKIGSRVTPKCGTLRKFTQTTKKKQAILLEAFINSEFFLQQNGKKFL